jgi:hypothetical protein
MARRAAIGRTSIRDTGAFTLNDLTRRQAQLADPRRSTRALVLDQEVAARLAADREQDPTIKAALLARVDELAAIGRKLEATMPGPTTIDPAKVRATFAAQSADLTARLARIKEAASIGGDPAKLAPLAAQVQWEIGQAAAVARSQMAIWASETEADATRRYAEDPIGSAADESRRVANELKLARLAKSVTSTQAAAGMLEKARELFRLGAYAEAQVYATVAKDGGAFGADNLAGACQTALDQSNPARKATVADRNEARTALAVFTREALAQVSRIEAGLSDAAREMGDAEGAQAAGVRAAMSSVGAKVAAFVAADESGTDYADPMGGG